MDHIDIEIDIDIDIDSDTMEKEIDDKFTGEGTDLIENPFYVGIDGSVIYKYELRDLFQIDHVHILFLKNDEMSRIIYDKEIETEIFDNLMKNFGLIKINGKILFEKFYRKIAVKVSNEFLRNYFDIEDTKGIDNIVIPLVNKSYDEIIMLKKFFERELVIDDYDKLFETRDTLDLTRNGFVNNRINEMLKLDTYWSIDKNCNFNMDNIFTKRNFIVDNPFNEKLFINLKGVNKFNKALSSYTPDDSVPFDKFYSTNKYYPEYMDIEDTKIGKNKFIQIFQQLKLQYKRSGDRSILKQRYNLFNSLLTSKKYCHYAINNREILEINSDLFSRYMPAYSYAIGYAWITLYLEECIINSRSKKSDRHVFDIDTASKLPMFPFTFDNIHSNPYVSLLVSYKLYENNKCFSIKPMEDYKRYYGICDKEEFFKRFNVFASGKSDVNIFEGIDSRYSISGSMIPACAMKYNPLIDKVSDDKMSFDSKYNSYFEHYYENSDIDVMVNSKSTFEFIKNASDLIKILVDNVGQDRNKFKLNVDKKTAVNITKHFFEFCIDDYNDQMNEEHDGKELMNEIYEEMDEDFKSYFFKDYVLDKTEMNRKWKKQELVEGLEFDSELIKAYRSISSLENISFNMVDYDLTKNDINKKDSEIYYFVNDFLDEEDHVPSDKNYLVFKYAESIKFKIQSSYLKREIEVFSNPMNDPFNKVARFHLPCVRAYIQNNNVYMLPSFITSMMTTLNIDYKYFAGSRDPIQIINKYRGRGFSNILNDEENKVFVEYNNNNKNKRYYESCQNSILDINDKIFMPKIFDADEKVDDVVYNKLDIKYMDQDKLKKIYEKYIDVVDFTKISFVNKNGHINSLKPWILDSVFK